MFLPDWCCVRCGCLGCGLSLAPAPASQCEDHQYSNMLIGSNSRVDVIRYLTPTSNEKRLEGSKRQTKIFGKCMESARVWCVVYDQVCGVITGYLATVATAQPSPLTTALTAPDNSTTALCEPCTLIICCSLALTVIQPITQPVRRWTHFYEGILAKWKYQITGNYRCE